MLASPFDPEDSVQDTLLRACRALDKFDKARGGMPPWLDSIATNLCFDMRKGRRRRELASELGLPGAGDLAIVEPLQQSAWLLPVPDALLKSENVDPAMVAVVFLIHLGIDCC